MVKEIPIGARGEASETVEFKHTLTAHHPELPPVYSTPDMIRLMETAAFHALQPYCEGDEITVGTSINIQHRARERHRHAHQADSCAGVVRWSLLRAARKRTRRRAGNWQRHSRPRSGEYGTVC